MFLQFFANLRQAHVPATPREYLDLMRALEGDLARMSVDEFYRLARALLVKDERNLDRFDVVFAATFKGVLTLAAAVEAKELPEEWLRRMA
ncbi:MAG: VWA domain-containing protein, partial [Roseiarcus sp.]